MPLLRKHDDDESLPPHGLYSSRQSAGIGRFKKRLKLPKSNCPASLFFALPSNLVSFIMVAMHFPSEFMLARLALAEAGLWATRVNDDRDRVLVVKLNTDTLKWIHRGVAVNMLIGHVQVDGRLIRVLAWEVFDCATKPLMPNLPQVETWEVDEFDTLLGMDRFTVHLHNEQPFLSVLDATGSFPKDNITLYRERRRALQFYTAPIVTPLFRKAQEIFEDAADKSRGEPTPLVELFRWPLTLTNSVWNSVGIPDVGSFAPDEANEGQSHEDLLHQTLKPHFDGIVWASPQIKDGDKERELCDFLAVGKQAFLFEAKAFSVFDKNFDQTADRKASTIMKHFEKAIGQLQGAVKRLEKGIELVSSDAPVCCLKGSQFETLHGIVVVSNTSFDLPWLEIGRQLAEAQRPPRVYYHFVSLMEIQRMVAFSKGSSVELNQMFKRRGELVACSKNAHIAQDFVPALPTTLLLPPANGDCLGLRFSMIGEGIADWLLALFPLVYEQLSNRVFSGRVDFYHAVGKIEGVPAIGIGLAVNCTSEAIGEGWWQAFQESLFHSLREHNMSVPVAKSVRIETVSEITSRFREVLMTVEFQAGFAVAKTAEDRA